MDYIKKMKIDSFLSELIDKLCKDMPENPREFLIEYLLNLGPRPESVKEQGITDNLHDSGLPKEISFMDLTLDDEFTVQRDSTARNFNDPVSDVIDLTNVPTVMPREEPSSSVLSKAEKALKDIQAHMLP